MTLKSNSLRILLKVVSIKRTVELAKIYFALLLFEKVGRSLGSSGLSMRWNSHVLITSSRLTHIHNSSSQSSYCLVTVDGEKHFRYEKWNRRFLEAFPQSWGYQIRVFVESSTNGEGMRQFVVTISFVCRHSELNDKSAVERRQRKPYWRSWMIEKYFISSLDPVVAWYRIGHSEKL